MTSSSNSLNFTLTLHLSFCISTNVDYKVDEVKQLVRICHLSLNDVNEENVFNYFYDAVWGITARYLSINMRLICVY